jgi:hypothetical protein
MTEDSSRWNLTKSRSNWHFDTTRPPKEGLDSFTHVCRFDADFSEAIAYCMPNTQAKNWAAESRLGKGAQNDLIEHGANPDSEIFSFTNAHDIELFQKISEYLGIKQSIMRFHNQTTGQMLHLHLDILDDRTNLKVKKASARRRFAIMLADWQLGQIFQIGNANFTQWQAGDCITWEWQDMPHSTANMGWWDRPMLQLSGLVTKRTLEVLSGASKNLVVKL